MKIKRIICLVLCLVMAAFALVSCEEDIITEAMNEKDKIDYKPVVLDTAEIDLYIITDGDIKNSTTGTVNDKIQQYLSERAGKKFNTELNIVYYNPATKESSEKNSAGENIKYDSYEAFIENRTKGIVLVNSLSLLTSLVSANKLADVNGYFVDADLIKQYEFAKLNASYNATNPHLLSAARDYISKLEGGKVVEEQKLYFVPNNRVMGSYEYLLINRKIVCDILNYNEDALKYEIIDDNIVVDEKTGEKVLRTWDSAAVDALKAEITAKASVIESIYGTFSIDEIVKTVSGEDYAARVGFENDGYICNIVEYPTLSKEELAEAGFAILNGGFDPFKDMTNATADEIKALADYKVYEAAAMEIIYLINSDKQMRNLLLYGVEGIHFDLVDGVVVPEETNFVYKMNLELTGDIFQAYFCNDTERDVWTEEMKSNGLKQNLESKFAR